jgi:hypothetical protein
VGFSPRTNAAAYVVILFSSVNLCRADSIETQNNPVPNGTIQVAEGSTDRTDWTGIPWYQTDEDDLEYSPVDIDRVQIAHDAQNLYFHLVTLNWDVDEAWRVGTYIDTDHDPTTGYNGNFLAVGADFFVEADSAHEFAAGSQTEWVWNQTASLTRDQTSMVDVEVAVPREALGGPSSFDFLLFANNFCCDFGLPDDGYPNLATTLGGEYFSYELGPVVVRGDFDNSGALDAPDVNQLSEQIALGTNPPAYDLNADNLTNISDLDIWVRDLKKTWFGDSNLDGQFNSSDLVAVFQAGRFERDENALWTEGDWNADRRFNSGDLVRAFQDGGFEMGPRAAVAGQFVPEPTFGTCAWSLLAIGGFYRRVVQIVSRSSHWS